MGAGGAQLPPGSRTRNLKHSPETQASRGACLGQLSHQPFRPEVRGHLQHGEGSPTLEPHTPGALRSPDPHGQAGPLCLCSAPLPPWAISSFLPPCQFTASPLWPACSTSRKPSQFGLCKPLPVRPSRPRWFPREAPGLGWTGLGRALWPPHQDPRPGLTVASTSRARPNVLVGCAVVALPLEQVTHQDAQQPHEAEDRHDGNNRVLGSRLLVAARPCAVPGLPGLLGAAGPCCHRHTASGPLPPL